MMLNRILIATQHYFEQIPSNLKEES